MAGLPACARRQACYGCDVLSTVLQPSSSRYCPQRAQRHRLSFAPRHILPRNPEQKQSSPQEASFITSCAAPHTSERRAVPAHRSRHYDERAAGVCGSQRAAPRTSPAHLRMLVWCRLTFSRVLGSCSPPLGTVCGCTTATVVCALASTYLVTCAHQCPVSGFRVPHYGDRGQRALGHLHAGAGSSPAHALL